MYKLKSAYITIEDTEDQIGVNPDSTPKYQTYLAKHDPAKSLSLTVAELKAKIDAQKESGEKSLLSAVKIGIDAGEQITSLV